MQMNQGLQHHCLKPVWFVVSALSFFLLAACQPKDKPDSRQSDSSLLVYCSEGSPDSFNPQLVTNGTSIDATSNTLYSRLVEYVPGSTEIIPALAKSWQVSPDGLRYRFQLNPGVAFHSNQFFTASRFLNADDVIFSFTRQSDKSHPYHFISGGNYPYYYSQSLDELIVEINKISEFEIEFVLSRPESPFISLLASPFASILSQEYGLKMLQKGTPTHLDNNPIGTGPFQFIKYEIDSFIRYKRFEQYYAGGIQIDDLVFSITPDAAMRFSRFSAGECDIMSYPLPVHLKVARQKADFQTLQIPGLNVAYWAFNLQKPPFDDVRVRQALNMAINRSAILKTVYDQQAILATSPLPPNSWAHDANIERSIYAPKLAKQLLETAGYGDGFKIEIWAMPVQRAYNPNARKMAEMMQQDLLKIGVKAKIVSFEWGTFLSKVKQGQHHSVLLGWNADNGDPNNFLTPLLSCASSIDGSNYARWCNQTFDELLINARKTTDPEARKALYKQAQTLFKQQAPWLTLAHANRSLLVQNNVQGASVPAFGNISFNGVYLQNPLPELEAPLPANTEGVEKANGYSEQAPKADL